MTQDEASGLISWADFEKVQLRAGTVQRVGTGSGAALELLPSVAAEA